MIHRMIWEPDTHSAKFKVFIDGDEPEPRDLHLEEVLKRPDGYENLSDEDMFNQVREENKLANNVMNEMVASVPGFESMEKTQISFSKDGDAIVKLSKDSEQAITVTKGSKNISSDISTAMESISVEPPVI